MQQVAALESSVLVLNKFFMALHVVSAKRAFALLCKETAEVISIDDGKFSSYNFENWKDVSLYKAKSGLPEEDNVSWIRTVSFEIEVPKIIRLLFYDKLPQSSVKFNRRNIFARDENKCQYCGQRFPTSELSLDHIVPKTYHGKTTWTNIVCACTECNKKKGGRTPEQAGMRLKRKPVKPKHSPILSLKLRSDKYRSWKQFLDEAYWSVPLK
ncbi:MAG: HNH endonuclease [Candidatus Jettenia sp.]|uniref:Endonuclease n=1 Tax=Candidatus Jettenia caeni TaxID=247490 RepID=I3IIV9_9BACT|nr:HNH endonuclease [Candidatus Jettenia sp. AMX1]MBC6928350.1 HNH endonuclease [Candidatus Jettenia sp.]NUN22635.1 HNH endonuclease [Candidatus Jettenia caeni]KAA0251070.1 MAG: HNH endonuclease [Candidatus Jettenia sp. AMX1]MCE7880717.1 HNH endonuclease [Candidatus Jettenia sp. AMX1]MCQ3926415.1 HNH endonuclease [Candidatus Jettenia sp.]